MKRLLPFALLLLSSPAFAEEPPKLPLGEQPPPIPVTPIVREPLVLGEGPKCEGPFIERVYSTTKPSVVRITRPDGGLGTGFVFHSKKHVATALHVVDLGRDVRVEFPGGKMTTAQVVGVDEAHDLAILELAEETDAAPLLPRTEVPVGAALLAIGNPYGDLSRSSADLEGLLNFSISQGIVSAKSDNYLQTDAALSPGNSGGPMLTCDGRVVGIADKLLEARIGFGVPVVHLLALATKLHERNYYGRVTNKDAALGVAWNFDTSTYIGPYLGGSLVAADRVSLTVRVGVLFAGRQDTSDPVVERSSHRFFGDLTMGYRFLFFPYAFPLYLTVAAGGVATVDRGSETRLVLDAGNLKSVNSAVRGGGIEPLAQATLNLGFVEASYGFALDTVHPSVSTHRMMFGLSY